MITFGSLVLLAIVIGIYVVLVADAPRDAASVNTVDQRHPDQPRIAALLPFAADQLLEMGYTPVAVPAIRGDVPVSWDGIVTVSVDHAAGPNIEQLIALDPDVIITSSVYAQFTPTLEREVGAQVVSMDVDSIDSVATHIQTLANFTQLEQESEALIERISQSLGSVSGLSQSSPRTLAMFGTPHSFYAFLPDSYLGDLIELSGGTLITSDMESHPVFRGLAPVSMEAIIDRDPELLIVVFHGPEETARAMLERDPLWSQMNAVQNNRVAFLQDDLYAMRPGSELPRAIEEVRGIVQDAAGKAP